MDEICINSTEKHEKIRSVSRVGIEVKGFDVAKTPINRAFLKDRYFWKTVLIHF